MDSMPFLFLSSKGGKPLSPVTLSQLVRGLGYGVKGEHGNYVPYGFRPSCRDCG